MAENKMNFNLKHLTPFFHLLRNTRPPILLILVILILSLIQTLAGLFIPLIVRNMIDQMSDLLRQPQTILFLIMALIVQAITSGISHYSLGYIGQQMIANIRIRVWRKVLALQISYFDHKRSGETVSRITNDTNLILMFVKSHIISFLSNLVAIVGGVSLLFYLDWILTTIILIAIPVALMLLIPLGRTVFKISKKLQDEMANLTSDLSQVISEIRLVKSYTSEPFEANQGEQRIQSLARFGIKESAIQAVLSPFISLIMTALLVTVIGYGGVRVSTGLMSAGELIAFILLLFQIIVPFTQFATFYTELQRVLGATESIQNILTLPEEFDEETIEVDKQIRDIDIQHLHFSYQPGEPVLHNISFKIPAKKNTAIVGPSGSGKSTLFSLIERFYVPESGQINYGNDPIEQYSYALWRKKIAYVSQECPMLAGTIKQNITYGIENEVTDAQIIEASQMAYAHAFIEQLPKGYDTEVGERGVMLSGGQRQRIAIARALLRHADILLLDEATSQLDSTSEHEIQKALHDLKQGRTTVTIAHRLSTVIEADQIVVLEKGHVTGIGTHEQLIDKHKSYRELTHKQFGLMNKFKT